MLASEIYEILENSIKMKKEKMSDASVEDKKKLVFGVSNLKKSIVSLKKHWKDDQTIEVEDISSMPKLQSVGEGTKKRLFEIVETGFSISKTL